MTNAAESVTETRLVKRIIQWSGKGLLLADCSIVSTSGPRPSRIHVPSPGHVPSLCTGKYLKSHDCNLPKCPSTRKRQVTSWTDYVYHLNDSRISCQYVAGILSGALATTHIAWNALSNQCAHFVFACYCLGCCAVGRQLTIVFDSELVRGTLLDVCVCVCP